TLFSSHSPKQTLQNGCKISFGCKVSAIIDAVSVLDPIAHTTLAGDKYSFQILSFNILATQMVVQAASGSISMPRNNMNRLMKTMLFAFDEIRDFIILHEKANDKSTSIQFIANCEAVINKRN